MSHTNCIGRISTEIRTGVKSFVFGEAHEKIDSGEKKIRDDVGRKKESGIDNRARNRW